MALKVETGAIVTDANCYGVVDEATTRIKARQYASDRGYVLPAADAALDALLIKATDYIESFAALFVGSPVSDTQALSWPRKDVRFGSGNVFPPNALPQPLLSALYQLCIEQAINKIALQPSTKAGGFVIRKRIDVLDTQYSERIGITGKPTMPAVDASLSTLLWNRTAVGLKVIRA